MIGFTPNPTETTNGEIEKLNKFYNLLSEQYSHILSDSIIECLPKNSYVHTTAATVKISVITHTLNNYDLIISTLFPVGFINKQLAEHRILAQQEINDLFNQAYETVKNDFNDFVISRSILYVK